MNCARGDLAIITRPSVTGNLGALVEVLRPWNKRPGWWWVRALGGPRPRIVPLHNDAPAPHLTADLAQPIGAHAWSFAFLPVIARVCHRHRVEPHQVRGTIGLWLQGSLANMFAKHVDFEALRRAALDYLAPDPR